MSEAKRVLSVRVQARDEMTKRLKKAAEYMRKFAEAAVKAMAKVGRAIRRTAAAIKKLVNPIALATGALGGIGSIISVRMATDVEKSLFEIGTLLQHRTDEELQTMSKKLRAVAIRGGQDFASQFRSAYDAISGGVAEDLLIQQQEVVNKLAIGGVTDSATANDLLTSAMNSYGIATAEAADVADTLFTTVRLGKTTITQLAGTFGRAAASASAAGLSMEEYAASIAMLTANGNSTEEAVVRVQAALSTIIALTDDQRAQLRDLGVDLTITGIRTNGWAKTLGDLNRVTGGNIEAIAAYVKNVRALQGVLTLGRGQGRELAEVLDQFADKAGAADAAFERMSSTLSFKLGQMRAAFAGLAVDIGNAFLPAAKEATDQLREFVEGVGPKAAEWAKITAEAAKLAMGTIKASVSAVRKLVFSDEDGAAKALGAAWVAAAELAGRSVREIAAATLLTVGNVVQVFGRNMLLQAPTMAAEIGRRVWQALKTPFTDTEAEIVARREYELKRLALDLEQAVELVDLAASDAERRHAAAFQAGVRSRIAAATKELEAAREVVEAPIRAFEESIGSAFQAAADGMVSDAGDVATAWSNAFGRIGDHGETFTERMRSISVGSEPIAELNRSVAEMGREFDRAVVSIRSAGVTAEEATRRKRSFVRQFQAMGERAKVVIDDATARAAAVPAQLKIAAKNAKDLGRALLDMGKDAAQGAGVVIGEIRRIGQEAEEAKRRQTFSGGYEQAANEYLAELIDQARRGQEAAGRIMVALESGFERTVNGMVRGTLKLRDAFRDMAQDIVAQIAIILAKQAAIGFIQALFPGAVQNARQSIDIPGLANGGLVQGGGSRPVLGYAAGGLTPGGGGIVANPTLFVAGEGRHREAIVPLPDGRSIPAVVKDGPQQSMPQERPVNVSIHIESPDVGGVKRMLFDNSRTIEDIIRRAVSSKTDFRQVIRGA